MNYEERMRLLREEMIFFSRLGFCYDPPLYDEGGFPLVFSKNYAKYARFHREFGAAGVKLHTCILHSGWVGVDQYDYALTDKVLEVLFEEGGVDYFIPRIKLNVPVDWCAENPEEVFVYYEGPRDAEDIRSLVGTLRQDYIGYSFETGYYNADGEFKDTRPNVGGLIARQSFSSKKWLSDATEALRRLIRHLEEGPYGDRILAYHIAYGTSGETTLWGRMDGKTGDYGIVNQKAFYDWGIARYGSAEALSAAWGERRGDTVPSPTERYAGGDTLSSQFRSPENRLAVDYDTFMSEVNTDAVIHFGKVVKEETGKPVGAFYGYIIEVDRSAYSGHLGWERLLSSPYVDFFAAPKSYYRSTIGEAGGELTPVLPINRRKLWIDECDMRTHLSKDAWGGSAESPAQTRVLLSREFAKNISRNSGFWWMDLGGGWYDDADIMKDIAHFAVLNAELRREEHKSTAEILVVLDEESYKYADERFHIPVVQDTLRNIQLCGAAVDVTMMNDFYLADQSGYRLVVFLNLYRATEADLAKIRAKLGGDTALLFHYAPGICGTGREATAGNVTHFAGIAVTENVPEAGKAATLHITDPAARVWQRDALGRVTAAERDGIYLNTA